MSVPELRFAIQWRAAVIEKDGNGYAYPSEFTSYFRSTYRRPVIYQWRVHPADPGKMEELYIGQADNLVTRIQNVLTATEASKGGVTNKRLKKAFDIRLAAGKRIFLDIADIESFMVNGALISNDELKDAFKRTAVEYLLLIEAQRKGHPLLNKVINVAEREALRYLRGLPAVERERVLGKVSRIKRGPPDAD